MNADVPSSLTNDGMDLGWMHDATELLRSGLSNVDAILHPKQQEVLHSLLDEGRNTLYIDKTGGGKSATYFLATKLLRTNNKRAGPTIVISPLLALVNDQLEKAANFDLVARTINSNTTGSARKAIFRDICRNEVDMLYVTAEMLCADTLYEAIPQLRVNYEEDKEDAWTLVALLVIDEVHCVSEWGHDFRAAYFSGLRNVLKAPWAEKALKLGASATVPMRVEKDLHKVLGKFTVIRGDLWRSNISIRVIPGVSSTSDKSRWLSKWAQQEKSKENNALVFAQSKNEVEIYTKVLVDQNIRAVSYHGSLPAESRVELERRFKSGEVKVVVSTIALAMGFDKHDVHTVIHTYTPASPVQYYQEIGRAGRGLTFAEAIILPTVPWRTDIQRDVAMQRILELLQRHNHLARKDICAAVSLENVTQQNAEDALLLGIGKEYFTEAYGTEKISLNREPSKEEKAERQQYVQERQAELRFMKKLVSSNPSASFCIWQQLLGFLGQQLPSPCQNCARCAPAAGDIQVRKVDECFLQKTPKHGIPVIAFAKNKRDNGLDIDLVKQALIDYDSILVAADPPSWKITYVPDSRNANKGQCEELAQALGLDMFEYITTRPGSKSMTQSHTKEVREEVLQNKFTLDIGKIPAGNILIYDDAMKSGMTLDEVCTPFSERKVVAIVQSIWCLRDYPEPVTRRL